MAITYHAGRRIQAISADAVTATNFGTIDTTSSPNNTIITFTKSGTFAPTSAFDVEYLVVAGGGSGGDDSGGGGGAGGFRTDTAHGVTAQSYSITVGDGSTVATDDPNVAGGNGADSIFDTITSTGGGGGASNSDGQAGVFGNGKHGGSGGGAGGGGTNTGVHVVGSGNTPSTTPSQGNNGGLNVSSGSFPNRGGGGGGGAGVVGSPSTGNNGGAGGNGKANPIVGSTSGQLSGGVYYLSGGGGGAGGTAASASGGLGGGGASTTTTSVSGSPNTGGGGGASIAGQPSVSGAGGSGIVIIKFVTSGNTYTIEGVTNAQVGSRFEETDTRKMYHKLYNESDITGANVSLTGLKAYYNFDETSGTLVNHATAVGSTDSLGTDADGTVNGTLVKGVSGKIGTAWSFDGNESNYVDLGASTSQWNFLHNTSSHWTVSWWMKMNVTSPAENQFIFGDHDEAAAADIGFGLVLNDLGTSSHRLQIEFGIATSNPEISSADNFIPKDTTTWYHYIVTGSYSAGQYNIELYRNNANNESLTLTFNANNSNSDRGANIGINGATTNQSLNAKLDELSVWDRILTSSERAELYNSGSGKRVNISTWSEEGT